MIGDNPSGDIAGANQANWRSILVQSGLYKRGELLDGVMKPNFEVKNMEEAVQLIMREENLTDKY